MATPSDIAVVVEGQQAGPKAAQVVLVEEYNKLVTKFRALMVKLDAETLAASDYVATLADDDSDSPALLDVVQ